LIILKKLRKKITIVLSSVLTIGACFTVQISNIYAEEDEATEFYKKCGNLIQENWNENNDVEDDSTNKEFQTMRLILKTKNSNLDIDKYKAKDIIKYNNMIVLQFDTIEKTKNAYEDLKSNKYVEYIDIDKVIEINSELGEIVDKASNDNLASSYNLDSYISYNSWGVEKMEANKYSNYLLEEGKNNDLIIAVVDTGVDYNHLYLSERLLDGYNFISGNDNIYDDYGHGTHVSGTIVDCTLSLSKIKILPIKVLNNTGKGTMLAVGNGINYAISNGADVINLSLGGEHSLYVDEAVQGALSKNISVVVSAGNENKYINDRCPAHISDATVVSSVDKNDNKSSFSNYGPSVDICAPGENILSCYPGNRYIYMSGTSMSVPHISATVAMYRLENPNLSVHQISSLLKTNTRDLGSTGWDKYYGYGIPKLGILTNSKPVINASDKVIKLGDVFKPLSGVSASDKEDGNITSKIVVNENTVDTSKSGIYKVVYSVTDSNNATTTKEIKVRVVAEGELIDIDGHWAESQIKDFMSKGYIEGYEDFTFKPNNSITRAEFIKIFNRYFGLTKKSQKSFKDTENHWAKEEIDIAYTCGVINGFEDNTFRPDEYITREQAAKIISNYKKLSDDNFDKLKSYKDFKDVSNWAETSVEAILEEGYMNGYPDNTYRPKGEMTRAEAVVTLSRIDK